MAVPQVVTIGLVLISSLLSSATRLHH